MGSGLVDFTELRDLSVQRTQRSVQEILTQRGMHEQMSPHGLTVRECVASDDHQNPLPILFALDTTGSMRLVPERLIKKDLLHLLTSLESTGATNGQTPQICFCGVADTSDSTPFQMGQFEADNRMDGWLQKINLGGGGGAEYMYEAYGLVLYALARKTKCDIWQRGKKGYAVITGDEMCPSSLSRQTIQKVFGDDVPHNLSLKELLAEAQEKWNLYFFYVATGSYQEENIERIYDFWKNLLGDHAVRLNQHATALPEILTAIIGINERVFSAEDVPVDLRELGCEEEIVLAAAKALGVDPQLPKNAAAQGAKKRRRGPKEL